MIFAVLKKPEWAKRPCIKRQTRKVRIFFCLFYLYFGKEEASCILLSKASSLANQHRLHIYIYIDIALWCKNQIEHSIWDESLLFSNCARSLEYSSSSSLAGLSYHICGKLEVAFKASPSSQHQHCTDEAHKAETVSASDVLVVFFFRKRCLRRPVTRGGARGAFAPPHRPQRSAF